VVEEKRRRGSKHRTDRKTHGAAHKRDEPCCATGLRALATREIARIAP
jgi:hypothetical protein